MTPRPFALPLAVAAFAAAALAGCALGPSPVDLLFRLAPAATAVTRPVEDRYGSDHRPVLGVVRFGVAAG